jgi:effector protein SdbA
MMIGCSGGGGHNAAINGIIDSYSDDKQIFLRTYPPKTQKSRESASEIDLIYRGLTLMSLPLIGPLIKFIMFYTYLPVLPQKTLVEQEVQSLFSKDSVDRKYIDMLLDVYPAGHESAALWNVLQKMDQTADLKKLINLQEKSDEANYQSIVNYYKKILREAAEKGEPFTELVSTQAMGLPALCDAVIAYNEWVEEQRAQRKDFLPTPVIIHQYMTDLATEGAVHFFNPLSSLSKKQQQQMKLYGVGLSENLLKKKLPGHAFSSIQDIIPDQNPMIRKGFKDSSCDHSASLGQKTIELRLDGELELFSIEAQENIASIMLGSQAGNDSYEYIESCLQNGCDKVFIFGGKNNRELYDKIQNLIDSDRKRYAGKIIPLGNQSDRPIAALMSRSNTVIIRGGGLSVMEQMAMNHSCAQSIFIHHGNTKEKELTSGISWEDHNVEKLITFLKGKNVHSQKTSPSLAREDLSRVNTKRKAISSKSSKKTHSEKTKKQSSRKQI